MLSCAVKFHQLVSEHMDIVVYNAAIRGEIQVLEQNREALLKEATPNKNTVLHLSAQLGKTECVQAILSMHPSLLLRQNSSGESPLHLAARDGYADTVKALVECAEKYFISSGGELESGVGGVKALLRMTTVEENETALHLAVRHRRVEVVVYLTRRDPEFEHPANKDGETPLYLAASQGYEELVDVMLSTCSSPATGGPGGRSALHGAVNSNSQGIISKLLERNGSLVKEADIYGWTPLHLAARNGVASMVGQLLWTDKSAGYLVDYTDDKNTALHIAAAQGHADVVKLFLEKCPDCCEIVNGRGRNILHIALEHKREITINCILECCTTINTLRNQKDHDGNIPGHLLAATNYNAPATNYYAPELVRNFGTDTNAFNNQNFSTDANSFMLDMDKRVEPNIVVATLVATIAFTAAFTVPGGYNEKGMATLAKKTAFQAFMISDTIALLLSTLAVVVHFLAPEYEKEKRYRSYLLGGTLIVLAIGTMMVAFVTGTYVMLAHSPGLAISVCVIGSSFFLFYFALLLSHFPERFPRLSHLIGLISGVLLPLVITFL